MPRRREVLAALAALAVVAGLLTAQITLALALALHVTGRISRWRPQWLVLPAACGAVWALAAGPARAVAGFASAPRPVVAMLARMTAATAHPHPGRPLAWPAHWPSAHWLTAQFPLALVVAAAITAAGWWLRWLHTDEWDLPTPRPGPVSVFRGRITAVSVRSGSVLTRDGVSLGVNRADGRPAGLSWREAERGVLVTGADPLAVEASSFQLVHAAIRRRKPVVAVDLAGSPGLAASVADACAAAGAPLRVFGAEGNECYEPWRDAEAARGAVLVMGLVDWDAVPDSARLSCRSWLAEAFAVAAAAPGDPGAAMLDEVAALLHPGALRARLERVPSYHPGRQALTERVDVAATRMEADQATASLVAGQLRALRASPLGRWLCPGPTPAGQPPAAGTHAGISLDEVVRRREVALFSLDADGNGRVSGLIAGLVALDVAGVCRGLHRSRLSSDGLAWFGGCERTDPAALAGLAGAGAGLAAVVSTTSPGAAGRLAGQVGVLVLHRLGDPDLAGRLSWMTGARLRPTRTGAPMPPLPPLAAPEVLTVPPRPGPLGSAGLGSAGLGSAGLGSAGLGSAWGTGHAAGWAPDMGVQDRPAAGGAAAPAPTGTAWCPVVTGECLCRLREGEFTLVARGPSGSPGRVIPLARAVPGRIPGWRAVPADRGARVPSAPPPAVGRPPRPPGVSPTPVGRGSPPPGPGGPTVRFGQAEPSVPSVPPGPSHRIRLSPRIRRSR